MSHVMWWVARRRPDAQRRSPWTVAQFVHVESREAFGQAFDQIAQHIEYHYYCDYRRGAMEVGPWWPVEFMPQEPWLLMPSGASVVGDFRAVTHKGEYLGFILR